MSKLKPYKYRVRQVAPPDYNHVTGVQRGRTEHEQFVGSIGGVKASDLEERWQRALDKLEIAAEFRVRITSQALGNQRLTKQFANVRGEVEIDFLVDHRGVTTPVFIDGQIGHFHTPYQADEDRQKTIIADEFGRQFGWAPSLRVPFWELIDQNYADRKVRNTFV